MITKLRTKNFKSWKDSGEINLAPLTGFFGTNSSGKSSLLQLFLLMKQTIESPDRTQPLLIGGERSLVDLGTFNSILFGHSINRSLELGFTWKLDYSIPIDPSLQKGKAVLKKISSISFDTSLVYEATFKEIVVDAFSYYLHGFKLGMKRDSYFRNMYIVTYDDRLVKPIPSSNIPQIEPEEKEDIQAPSPIKCYGFPVEIKDKFYNSNIFSDVVFALEKSFLKVFYLGPLREPPKPWYIWAGKRPQDVGSKGEHAIAAMMAASIENTLIRTGKNPKNSGKTFQRIISEWLRKMNLIYSYSLQPIATDRKEYEFLIKTTKNSPNVSLTDVGFGVSQILPVLVLCYYVPEGSIILLEQPEIHLHPSVQADLADVLIDVVKERNVQIIVESHSEHLLRRLQRRIAEKQKISADQTALYFCRMDKGMSKTERLDVDEFGNIRNWPPNFFGDEMEDLAAQTKAEMKRKMADRR